MLNGGCCVLIGFLIGLNLLPSGCVLRSMGNLVLCVDGVVFVLLGVMFAVIHAVGPPRIV
jgi:hypothetical protein